MLPERVTLLPRLGVGCGPRPGELLGLDWSSIDLAARTVRVRASVYDLRHTYATWSLRAGVGIYQIARRMGTSVAMIDATYGRTAAEALEHELGLLDTFDATEHPTGVTLSDRC